MTTPKLTMSVNGGAFVTGFESGGTGGVDGPDNSTIQLGAQSTDGWQSQTWQIPWAPPSFAPGGTWTLNANGIWENTNLVPSLITLPTTMWGKVMTRVLVVYEDGTNAMDDTTSFRCISTDGLKGCAAGEGSQFGGPYERYVRDLDDDIRTLQTLAGGGGAGTTLVVPGAGPFHNLVVADYYDCVHFTGAGAAAVVVTGIVAPSGGRAKRLALCTNHGDFGVDMSHLSGSSSAANRFENLEPGASVNADIIYIASSVNKWRRIAYPG